MSRSRENSKDGRGAYSTSNRPTNKIGFVEILLAALFVYLLVQVVRFDRHTTRIHGDDTPTLALQ
jgi:hypothetical protein